MVVEGRYHPLAARAGITASALVIASAIASCGPRYGGCANPDGGGDAMALLSVGEDREGVFSPWMAGDEASLVFGPQGGWMVLVIVELPADWRDEDCVELIVDGQVDGRLGPIEVEPIAVRFDPARQAVHEGDVVRYGPIPFFLAEEVVLLEGQMLDLRARALSSRGRAELVLPLVLRRR